MMFGMGRDDTVLVHSSFRRMAEHQSPTGFITELRESVRNVMFPTFTYGFWQGEPWEYNTPSDTGVLGETARLTAGAVRSRHPFYSVAALGPDADALTVVSDRTAFGPGSVFRRLHDVNAWLCVINLRYDQSFTFFHYVEETEGGVPYRTAKVFTGLVEGRKEAWTMPVRSEGVRTWVEPMGELLHNVGVMRRVEHHGVEIKIGRAADVYDAVAHLMKVEPRLLYYQEPQ